MSRLFFNNLEEVHHTREVDPGVVGFRLYVSPVVIAFDGNGSNTSAEVDLEPKSSRAISRVQGYRIKHQSACGGCLGDYRRRRAWQPAKSPGELANEL